MEDDGKKRNAIYIMKMKGTNGNVLVDAKDKGTLTCFINHSCNPNCEYLHRTVEGVDQIWVKTKRDIQVGDALTCDYGWDPKYWKDIPCMCGYKECKFKNEGYHENPETKLRELHSGGILMAHKADGNCGYHALSLYWNDGDCTTLTTRKPQCSICGVCYIFMPKRTKKFFSMAAFVMRSICHES